MKLKTSSLFFGIIVLTLYNNVVVTDDLKVDDIEVVEQVQQFEEVRKIIFDSSNVGKISNITNLELFQALEGTKLSEYTDYYLEAEQTYNINALFLVSLTAHESGWGTSNRAESQNNLSGYGVYNSNAEGVKFNSVQESILRTAKLIREDYVNQDGKYYNGTSIYNINQRYCLLEDSSGYDANWTKSITSIGNKLYKSILEMGEL